MSIRLQEEIRKCARTWTHSTVFAREQGEAVAVYSRVGVRTFAQLDENANRLAHRLRAHGFRAGDAVALMCGNRPEFIEVLLACLRTGARLTPISTHLTPEEVRYILQDSAARLFFVEDGLAGVGLQGQNAEQVLIGSTASGSNSLEAWLARGSAMPIDSPEPGLLMLYTSGTTGRPKGVFRSAPEYMEPQYEGSFANYRPGDVALCCGPAYHSAPLLFDIRWPLASGVPIVLMDKWDAAEALRLIAQHRVTHAHMVPTMFQRLLTLPDEVRRVHDVSSLRFIVHGAAPCTPEIKRAMIDWLGPVLTEYYAATEGGNGIHVDSPTWLTKPGTVGRIDPSLGHCILDNNDQPVPAGIVGRIFFRAPEQGRFEYFGDAAKTADAYRQDRFTLGDLGYVDADGFLFLTGRMAECIISGGVNIYPREVDDILRRHTAVEDVCTVGAPDDDWGERVVSVVVPATSHAPSKELAQELLVFASEHLAKFKRPREIVFEESLPHSATGKLLRTQVRQRFWVGQARAI
jgi:long-chain acyl-CoA synthetase